MYENLKIETKRLLIRSFTHDDLYILHRIVNDEEIMKYVPFAKERTLTECKELMDRILKRYKESTEVNFKGFLLLVLAKENKESIGFVGLFPLSYNMNETEIFYGVFTEFRGLGFATEIGKGVIDYCFNNMNIDKVVATVNFENKTSKKVVDNIGMAFQYMIEDDRAKDSSYDGELLYSIEG